MCLKREKCAIPNPEALSGKHAHGPVNTSLRDFRRIRNEVFGRGGREDEKKGEQKAPRKQKSCELDSQLFHKHTF